MVKKDNGYLPTAQFINSAGGFDPLARFTAFASPVSDSIPPGTSLESEKAATARSFPLNVPPLYAPGHFNAMANAVKLRNDSLAPATTKPTTDAFGNLCFTPSFYSSAASSFLSSLSAHSHLNHQQNHPYGGVHPGSCGNYVPSPSYHFPNVTSPMTSSPSISNDLRNNPFAAAYLMMKPDERLSNFSKMTASPALV